MKAILHGSSMRLVRAQGVSGLLALTSLIGLTSASAAMGVRVQETPTSSEMQMSNFPTKATEQKLTSHAPAPPARYSSALSEVPVDELEAYRRNNDVLRLPFDSTIATIKTCLRRPDIKIVPCLEAGSKKQACVTTSSQCATAAEEAWQLYISHYLRLLSNKTSPASVVDSQRAWKYYIDTECAFQSTFYPDDDVVMRDTVSSACRAGKAQERALELRGSIIDIDG